MNELRTIETLMRVAHWQKAQSGCRSLLNERPTDAKLHALEGICFFRMGRFAAAEPCFQRATALDPAFVDAGVKRCQCLERMRRYDDAVYLAREWQTKRPSDPALKSILQTHGHRPDPYRTEAWQRSMSKTRSVEYARTA